MKSPPHHRFDNDDDDDDGNTFTDTKDYKLDINNDNNKYNDNNNFDDNYDDDNVNLSDIVRHTGDILKRRGLLLEKKLLSTSSTFQYNDNCVNDDYDHVVHYQAAISSSSSNMHNNNNQSKFNTRKSIINSNIIHARDSNGDCDVHQKMTPSSSSSSSSTQQQKNTHNNLQSTPQKNGYNNLSKGRRRALRWISDRASSSAQDEERRKKENNIVSSSPLSSLPSTTTTTTSLKKSFSKITTTASSSSSSLLPISIDNGVINTNVHPVSLIGDDDVSNTLAQKNMLTTIHTNIIKNEKTMPPSQRIDQRRHHHHHHLVNHVEQMVHEPSSSAVTSRFFNKAIHKETITTTSASHTNPPQRNRQPTIAPPFHSIPPSTYDNYNFDDGNDNTLDPNAERLLRFHEAYNAIIRATTLHPNNNDEGGGRNTISAKWLQSGGKRWTRDPNIVSAVSIDGRVYEDLQRTPTLSLKQITKGAMTSTSATLYDRAASWFSLVTPPKHSTHHHHRGVGGGGVVGQRALHDQQIMLADSEYNNLNEVSNGNEEDKSASHAYPKILQNASNRQRNSVPICQFYIDCRVAPVSDGITKQYANAERGRLVSISTLHLVFTGGRRALVSKPKRDTTRRKKLHQRRSMFDEKSKDKRPSESEMASNGRRRALNKLSNARVVSAVASTSVDSDKIHCSNATEFISPVSNVRKEEDMSPGGNVQKEEEERECALSSPPQSPQDRFNVIDFFKESLLYHLSESSIIDTDGTEIDVMDDVFHADEAHVSASGTPAARIQSMLMSPSLITKRYQQALKAIEQRNWKQISRMINANPWLMEMKDVRNDQSLVHTLAFFGGELNSIGHYSYTSLDYSNPTTTHLPEQLVRDIIEYEPSAVHKLDIEGNLPLHMAAASGNVIMIEELGRRFPGAASVQNHYGFLPLHLALIAHNDILATTTSCTTSSVELLLDMFPGAVGVKDNDGNFPLHMAAASLRGDDGVEVVNLIQSAYHDMMVANSRVNDDSPLPPIAGMCKNNDGETPLARAIQPGAGKKMVEALLHGEVGGKFAALEKDLDSRNALHLALDRNFHDASIVLSILKASPSTATIVDGDGMLPIQLACRNSLQHEVILAISIIDLPIDLGAANGDAVLREGYGASWWYLLCESNDEYVGVVLDILSLCSRPQKVALCLAKKLVRSDNTDCDGRQNRTVLSCATPRCELELRKRCLFWNRFEVISEMTSTNHSFMHKFDAVDHGGTQDDDSKVPDGGKRVSLYCYTDATVYKKDVEHLLLHKRALDSQRFEQLNDLSKEEEDDDDDEEEEDCKGNYSPPHSVSYRFCIVAEAPRKTMANVIAQIDSYDRQKYLRKSRLVLHGIAKSLYHLHKNNIIHGCIDSTTIGKFGSTDWKITGLVGSVVGGCNFPTSRLGLHSPPEAFVVMQDQITHEGKSVSVAPSLKAEPSVDVWAFGKLLYEVLVGESLFRVFLRRKTKSNDRYHHQDAWKCILEWNEDHHLPKITKKLISMETSTTGVDLISKCLSDKHSRTNSMKEIVNHPFWESC